MLKFIVLFCFIFESYKCNKQNMRWQTALQSPDSLQEILNKLYPTRDPFQKITQCQNCFKFFTTNLGRRMIVEPCGGAGCIPIVNSTSLYENEPTKQYNFSQCGIAHQDRFTKSRIDLQLKVSTSVKNTLRPAEYPWLVRIESRSNIFSPVVTLCGGTLIHPQWIVTAAHCMFDSRNNRLYSPNGVQLHMGNYNRANLNRNSYIATPSLYIVHPKFRITLASPAPIHDLALIKLADPIKLSKSIGVACLPDPSDKLSDGTLAFTAGWGHSSPNSMAVNEPRKARIKIAPKACQLLKIDNNLHICGRNDRGNNICSGDSGNGLMVRAGVKQENNQTDWKWHIFGVASFGLDECSENVNHDNAFASISADIDWIHEMINKF